MTGIVRAAIAADLRSIEDIVNAAYFRYVRDFGFTPAPLEDDYAKRISSGEAYVIECDDGVGGVLVVERAIDHVLVENIAVYPALQGRGYGRALLAFAESLAVRYYLPEVRLYTNAMMVENISFYTRCGYRETHRASIGSRKRVFMQKAIDA